VSHLKQFTYSFQKTITSRVAHEALHGNYTPLAVLASYVPMIIAADILRGVITPGGSDDERLKKWTAADWLTHGVARAGITGPGQYVLDAPNDLQRGGLGIGAVAGPTAQQLLDLLRAGAGGGDLGSQVLRAIPPLPALNVR
jgi:hypothetical protein